MSTIKTQQNIPNEWQSVFIDDICYVMKGQGLSKKDIDPLGKNKCLLYGELFTTYDEVIEEVKSRTNSMIGIPSVSGDILIPGSTTTVARDLAVASALNESGVLLGGDINILRKKDESYDSQFLAYYLTNYKKDEIGKLGQGITIVHLYGKNIKNLEVVIPKNIKEQQKIAEILGTVDEDIAKTQELIDTTEKLKKGLMQELFTTQNGWQEKKLLDCLDIPSKITGIKLSEYEKEGEFPVFDQGQDYISGFSSNKDLVVSDVPAILFGDHTRIVKYIKSPFVAGADGTKIFWVKDSFDSNFIYYVVLNQKIPNTGYNRHFKFFKDIKVVLPESKKEQQKIADILSSIDEKISVNKKLKEKLITLKKGLMQDLLSGRVRVNIN